MRSLVRKLLMALFLLLVPFVFSGCIVSIWDDHCCGPGQSPPRRAELFVHVYDYHTDVPIPWAVVELHEEHWFTWTYMGSWHVDPHGYTRLEGGLLYWDGYGGPEEEDYRVCVHADGYFTERYVIELSYRYPSEVLYFYLYPYHGMRENPEGTQLEVGENLNAEPSSSEHGSVVVGGPRHESTSDDNLERGVGGSEGRAEIRR